MQITAQMVSQLREQTGAHAPSGSNKRSPG